MVPIGSDQHGPNWSLPDPVRDCTSTCNLVFINLFNTYLVNAYTCACMCVCVRARVLVCVHVCICVCI